MCVCFASGEWSLPRESRVSPTSCAVVGCSSVGSKMCFSGVPVGCFRSAQALTQRVPIKIALSMHRFIGRCSTPNVNEKPTNHAVTNDSIHGKWIYIMIAPRVDKKRFNGLTMSAIHYQNNLQQRGIHVNPKQNKSILHR